MAEAKHSDKSTPHRRHQQNRPPYSNRGRGRLDPHVSKALYNFGVTDLRELLDRKHQDQSQSKSGPPPDPSYSYLKDPLRENTNCDNPSRIYYKERQERVPESWSRGHSTSGSRGRGGYVNKDEKYHQFEASLIQNPINIKVALTTSTGERSCKLDEENKLVDIKYVSNHRPQERRSFRGERGRGRGSGGRGRGGYESGQERDGGDTRKEFRGRGGRRMGRGRERGGYDPRASNRNNHQHPGNNSGKKVEATECPTEDNWDIECSNSPPEQSEHFEKKEEENSLNPEQVYTHNSEEYEPEEYYTEDDEHSGVIEKNLLQIEAQEDLIITSSVPEKNDGEKRTVKFKLADKKDDAAQLQQVVDQSKPEEEKETIAQKDEKKGKASKTSKRETRERKRKEKPRDEKETKINEELKTADVSKVETVSENT